MNENDAEILTKKRKAAMSKRRRLIFDNDGGDVTVLCQGTSERDLLETRTIPALDAGADAYIYTTGGGFGVGKHDSRVGSVLKTRQGHFSNNKTAEFIRNGTDCLRIQAEYVKSRGVEFFWGMRMNDTHDAHYGGVHKIDNQFKHDNPEVMFGEGVKHGAVTAVDYLSDKVRNFALAYILDVVDRYDVDGVWLDFFRHPIFFRSNAQGLPATDEEIAAMTDLLRRLKDELDQRRLRDGKYYLVAVRVPDSVDYARAIGLDLETWLGEALIDLLFTTSYLKLNDWSHSVELGHRHGVPVYPSLDESRVRSEHSLHRRNCLKGFFGRIMNAWDAGCDGIFMFNNSGLRDMKRNIEQNWFRKDAGTQHDGVKAALAGPESVNTMSKTYFVSFRGSGNVAGGAFPHADHINIPTLNYRNPICLAAGETVELPLRVSDDVALAKAKGLTPKATLNAFILGDPKDVAISFNGEEPPTSHAKFWYEDTLDVDAHKALLGRILNEHEDLGDDKTEHRILADVPVDHLEKGLNAVKIKSTLPLALLDLWLDLDYP